MNEILVLAYTAGGGAIGAALNQYVTHVSQRRGARAAVVASISEIELLYSKIRWPSVMSNNISSKEKEAYAEMEKLLHALEGTALIAGIPRSIVSAYVIACRQYYTDIQVKAALDEVQRDGNVSVDQRFLDDSVMVELDESIKGYKKAASVVLEKLQEAQNDIFLFHDLALAELSVNLWHPIFARSRVTGRRRLNSFVDRNDGRHQTILGLTQRIYEVKNKFLASLDQLPAGAINRIDPLRETAPSNLIGANGSAVEDQIQGGAPGA